ncbi:MAG TPA: Clp protease N-terminal domain-containing protein [Pseudonocardiaceae bacterium]|nr:Clp protease N-terminal domain-containing protein [Pseudonocardiaceae bacterium]
MFERFTTAAREAVVRANAETRRLGHRDIGTGHLLLALLDDRTGPVAELLRSAGLDEVTVRAGITKRVSTPLFDPEDAAALHAVGIDLDSVLARINESFGPEALGGRLRARRGGPHMDKAAKHALQRALHAATTRRDKSLGAEHLLLGLLADDDTTAAAILAEAKVDPARLRADVLAALENKAA